MDRDWVQHSFHEPHGDIHELLLVFVLPRQCQSMLHLRLNTDMLVLSLREVMQGTGQTLLPDSVTGSCEHDLSEHSPTESN